MRHVIKNSIWQEQTEKGNFLYKQSLRYCRSIYSYLFKHTRFICFDLEENDYYQTTKLYNRTKSILFHSFAYC